MWSYQQIWVTKILVTIEFFVKVSIMEFETTLSIDSIDKLEYDGLIEKCWNQWGYAWAYGTTFSKRISSIGLGA